MKIEKIVYEKNEKDNVFDNCIVFYDDGTTEVTKDVSSKIMDFMSQEGLTFENVMKDNRIVNKKNIEDTKVKSKPQNETVVEEVSDSKNEKKKSGKNALIRITAIASALIIGGVAVDFILNKEKSKLYAIFGSKGPIKIEQTVAPTQEVTPMVTVAPVETPIVTEAPAVITEVPVTEAPLPTPVVVQEPPVVVEQTDTETDENYNDVFRENVDDTINNMDPLSRNVWALNNGEVLSEEALFDTINGINRLCQTNMAEVEKLIEGGKMSGDKIFPLFDEMFPKGSLERDVITSFTSRRNMLVENAYYQDPALTASEVSEYNDFFLDYIFGDVTFEYNGNRYGYYDISPIARYIVFMLGQTTLETNHGYVKDINGNVCDFNTIISELEENYNLITSQLFESGRVK